MNLLIIALLIPSAIKNSLELWKVYKDYQDFKRAKEVVELNSISDIWET